MAITIRDNMRPRDHAPRPSSNRLCAESRSRRKNIRTNTVDSSSDRHLRLSTSRVAGELGKKLDSSTSSRNNNNYYYNDDECDKNNNNNDHTTTLPKRSLNSQWEPEPEAKEPSIRAYRYETPQLARHLLQQISEKVLHHMKELGLFDEFRMKLSSEIETGEEFASIKRDFNQEIVSFCRQEADLGLSRARLREQLARRQDGLRSTGLLATHVGRVSKRHSDHLRQVYNEEAGSFLLRHLNRRRSQSQASPAAAKLDEPESEPLAGELDELMIASSQAESLSVDSGFSSSISPLDTNLAPEPGARHPAPPAPEARVPPIGLAAMLADGGASSWPATITDPEILNQIPLPPVAGASCSPADGLANGPCPAPDPRTARPARAEKEVLSRLKVPKLKRTTGGGPAGAPERDSNSGAEPAGGRAHEGRAGEPRAPVRRRKKRRRNRSRGRRAEARQARLGSGRERDPRARVGAATGPAGSQSPRNSPRASRQLDGERRPGSPRPRRRPAS